jgi:hypothetical protein
MSPASTAEDGVPRCAFCGRPAVVYKPVHDSSSVDIDCAMCGQYRISRDREARMLRKQFTRRARAVQLAEIRSANADGFRYSVDDGRPTADIPGERSSD